MPDPSPQVLETMVQRVLDNQRGHGGKKFNEVISRLGRLERTAADLGSVQAGHSIRMDRLSERIERIETRLDLRDA